MPTPKKKVAKKQPGPKELAERAQRREQAAFGRRIRTMFTNAGFIFLPTDGVHRKFGLKTGELDQVFIYDNIILICEETVLKEPRDHLKNKKLLFDEIDKDIGGLVAWLREDFADRLVEVEEYDSSRYKVFYLYFSKTELILDDEDRQLFAPVKVVSPSTLSYFHKMAQNIKRSARSDIFRYLELASADLGSAGSAGDVKRVETSIIYPNDNTGFANGIRVVSFMMSAETLLRNSYVLRKDNWQQTIELYQRLIERDRIQSIRKYLSTKKSAFINNIIVSLPEGVEFHDSDGKSVDLDKVSTFGGHRMSVPNELNSICVIDGQHRIYAHYEGSDSLEPNIAKLRKKFHLLVTALIYPATMPELERRKFESELFLDINSNARPVPPDVLLFIETLKDPFSDLGVARQVLQRMNELAPFLNEFQLSLMDDSKIKIASIIKFALRYLVDITDDVERPTLFQYWSTESDREALLQEKLEKKQRVLLPQYVHFAAGVLAQYFCAVKATNSAAWIDPAAKIKSVVSLNGYIMALRGSLPTHGVKDFSGYRTLLQSVDVSFSKNDFPYAASQYAKFSRQILGEAFGVVDSPPDATAPAEAEK